MKKFTDVMQQFIGTKLIQAAPMNRLDYNILRGWNLPENENGDDEGYIVVYLDGGKPNVEGFVGYVSWSPKEQFENAYQTSGKLSFGHAIVALKQGKKVARAGWNGKGMWLSLSCQFSMKVKAESFWSSNNASYARENGGFATVLPSITMKTATGEILMGWLASQSDVLADDWLIVD